MQKNLQSRQDIWCVIPVYNNGNTVEQVAMDCLEYVPNVLVVDDGSTDANIEEMFRSTGVKVMSHSANRGKGEAVRAGLQYVRDNGGRYMITIDADGQHFPQDLEKFIPGIKKNDPAIIIGKRNFSSEPVPKKSRFGRAFSNFWIRLETGIALSDTQSGFRAYPVKEISQIRTRGRHYDFEAEILARAAWAGLDLREIEVGVNYPPGRKRITHFRPFLDNLRISLTHTRLAGRRLVPWPHRKLVQKKSRGPGLFRQPRAFFLMLLRENATPAGLAASAAVGVFLGTLPLVSVHSLAILYVTSRLNLNKIMALSIQNLCIPPFVPALCIEIGYYMRHGKWLTDVSFHAVFGQIPERLYEWLLGSIIVAPAAAAIIGAIVFVLASAVRERNTRKPPSGKKPPRKRGNRAGFWFFKTALRLTGLRGAYGLLYIVCAYYVLFDRSAVKSALAYVSRRFPERSKLRQLAAVYFLFISQGKTFIDRFYVMSGGNDFETELKGYEQVESILRDPGKGFVLLTSHVGNWQVAMTFLAKLDKPINLVMRPEDNPAVKSSLNIDSTGSGNMKVISPEQHLGGIVEILNALKEGEIVAIMGDRSYGHNVLETEFFGDTAFFPHGAFSIAASAGCPVVILLSAKIGTRRYTVDFVKALNPRYEPGADKKECLSQYVAVYAETLEQYLEKHPYQCFLFHDVWSS